VIPQADVNESAPARPVDPAAIERELSALWMAEAEARKQAGRDAGALTRALLLNLLVFAPAEEPADRAREVIVALTGRQPSRAILMVADGQAQGSGIEAWISLYCTKPLGEADEVCGEQITVEARGTSVLDLPGTVLPLLLADRPTFLWWQSGSPLKHPIFDRLAHAVDRVIVDSLTFSTPPWTVRQDRLADLAEAVRAIEDEHFLPILTDLGWARLAPWRYLTAQIFDPQAVRPYLDEVERVRLTYYDGSPVLAWLFAGWLASRLEWRPARQEPDRMRFEGGQVVELHAVPPEEGMSGHLAGVHLTARDGATFEVARLPDQCAVTRVHIGGMKTESVGPMRRETLTDWLGHELNRLTRSAVYEDAVRLVARSRSAASLPRRPI
jgi:glucose-6-phosphate dehydrogenase assembly protein OpcA